MQYWNYKWWQSWSLNKSKQHEDDTAGKGMGFKARHRDWRPSSSGSYVNLATDSPAVTHTTDTGLWPQGDATPAGPGSAVPALGSSRYTSAALRRSWVHVCLLPKPKFSHCFSVMSLRSTLLLLLNMLNIIKRFRNSKMRWWNLHSLGEELGWHTGTKILLLCWICI